MSLGKFPTFQISGVTVGSVSFGAPNATGDRDFTFTDTNGNSQSTQRVNMTRSGNVRQIASIAPFSLRANNVSYDSFTGTVNIPGKTASGTFHIAGTTRKPGPEDTASWDCSDVVTPLPESTPAALHATAASQGKPYAKK